MDNLILKGRLRYIKGSNLIEFIKNDIGHLELFYRIISIGPNIYMGQEIVTGKLFPLYRKEDNFFIPSEVVITPNAIVKKEHYCLYAPLYFDGNLSEFTFDRVKAKDLIADENEVKKYLEKYETDADFKYEVAKYARKNIYYIDMNKVKEYDASQQKSIEEKNSSLTVDENSIKGLQSVRGLGYDLSTRADLCDAVCREKEYEKLIKSLILKGKSVLLLGESGCGKTALVEKLALDIKTEGNEWLNGKMIFSVFSANIEDGTNLRGEFETKLQKLIDFARKNKGQVILFFDEIHMLYGLGRSMESSSDAMNILKPYISSGDIIVVGATTPEEYYKYMAKDEAFCRRFDKIEVKSLSFEENIFVVVNYISELEEKYGIKFDYNDDERQAIVRYIVKKTDVREQKAFDTKITNPSLAKSILEDAFVNSVYQKADSVTIEDIYKALRSSDQLSFSTFDSETNNLKNRLVLSRTKNSEKIIPIKFGDSK